MMDDNLEEELMRMVFSCNCCKRQIIEQRYGIEGVSLYEQLVDSGTINESGHEYTAGKFGK
jgi:hypothetical protein